MTLKNAYEKGKGQLEESGIAEAEPNAWYLLEHVTGITRALYLLDSKKELDKVQETCYFELIEKRTRRIPLQHLTGVQEFMGLEFQVNEHVLIPRQDTEILVETALEVLQDIWKSYEEKNSKMNILDMCTGSGCIVLSILKLFEHPLSGVGVDISKEALETARKNAENLGVEAMFLQSDLFEHVEGQYAMMISNPPYIRTCEIQDLQIEVRDHEPVTALDGGVDGLHFYRKIIEEGRQHLVPGGYLLFEIGYDQAAEAAKLMWNAGFRSIAVKKDLAGLDRVVSGRYDERVESHGLIVDIEAEM